MVTKKSASKLKPGDELLQNDGTARGVVKTVNTTTDSSGSRHTRATMTNGRTAEVSGGYVVSDDVRVS